MKKLLVVLTVLAMAGAANAALTINVSEAMDAVSISGDDATEPGIAVYLFLEGPGSIDGGNLLYPGSLAAYADLEAVADSLGMTPAEAVAAFQDFTGRAGLADLSFITLADGAVPMARLDGVLVDGIALAGTDPVVLSLVSDDFATVYDSVEVPIPEPVTIALLGLGGLFLRRRR